MIATDLASRGLDLPNIQHVVNYDIPGSVKSYVHRVGRTARAGRKGNAWTMMSGREAGWFWGKEGIARGSGMKRAEGRKVKRIDGLEREIGVDQRKEYETALEALRREVGGG